MRRITTTQKIIIWRVITGTVSTPRSPPSVLQRLTPPLPSPLPAVPVAVPGRGPGGPAAELVPPAAAAPGTRGEGPGAGGRHHQVGAEVPGGEHHAAVRHGRRRHRRRAEVRRYDGLLSITWETRWRRAGLNLTR